MPRLTIIRRWVMSRRLAPVRTGQLPEKLMDSHEWNKIIGSVLGTVLFVLVVHLASQAI